MFDLIGDIHGYAEPLFRLLDRLGYQKKGTTFQHPDRKVIFLGDLIDRGPQIARVLETVRSMVDEGSALAVMGNHEYNAIAFQTENRSRRGTFLRRHTDKNTAQHAETLNQLETRQLSDYVNWFRSLPVWIDADGLRVVHACWDSSSVKQTIHGFDTLGCFTDDFMQVACQRGSELFESVEVLLKGKEIALPNGLAFLDNDGHQRDKIRAKWYRSAENETFRTFAFTKDDCIPDLPLPHTVVELAKPYPPHEEPVFVGHYWLQAEQPERLAGNVACLDYSVAKGGFLCGYRWDGEQQLSNDRFVIER